MAQVIPDWFRVVAEYGWKVGPTLPFILGVTRKPRGKPPASRVAGQEELHALLTRIGQEAPAGYGVNIQWCDTPGAYVVARTGGHSLTWAPEINAYNADTLAAAMWNLYGDAISDGKYSKNGDWHSFNKDELKRIGELLG